MEGEETEVEKMSLMEVIKQLEETQDSSRRSVQSEREFQVDPDRKSQGNDNSLMQTPRCDVLLQTIQGNEITTESNSEHDAAKHSSSLDTVSVPTSNSNRYQGW